MHKFKAFIVVICICYIPVLQADSILIENGSNRQIISFSDKSESRLSLEQEEPKVKKVQNPLKGNLKTPTSPRD